MSPARSMRIDFVSDVSCPWCAIGLEALREALQRMDEQVDARIHVQPFELNPELDAAGENATEHLMTKYGIDHPQVEKNREAIRQRGQDVGFTFATDDRTRIYNTFDAHRLLYWAGAEHPEYQLPLKRAMLRAYFALGLDMASHETLVGLVSEVGMDGETATEVLRDGWYAEEVRERERFYAAQGIASVPSIIIDEQHLIQGGQSPDIFEQALREVAAKT